MSHVQPVFDESELELLGRALDDAGSHAELAALFSDSGLSEPPAAVRPSKWLRIKTALLSAQRESGSGNPVLRFISIALKPACLVHDRERFDRLRAAVNLRLAFAGLQYREDGKFVTVAPAATIDQARSRAGRLRHLLEQRSVHPDVLRFCTAELTQENYFHAVLEATKSVSDKLRQKSGLTGDAGQLAMASLGFQNGKLPLVAFNSLRTDTEQSEQRGLCNLFVGMFGTFRNTTAHSARIDWNMSEQDALDLLTMVSFLHRRLDAAVCLPP
ncbi:MAG: TIGR02391 family protein [Opitutaceae bacterium]|jgi:uncharacterized protein (TIGR02391 family)